MTWLRRLLLVLLLGAVATPARAFVPQTITVDGVNDFDPQNLLDDDRNDTQPNCTPAVLPLDLGRVYVTNDANFLYIGIELAQTCFCDINLGMALDVGTAGGGTTDAFGRKIGWANVAFKPDFTIYDVTPTTCNTFNFEALYRDSSGTWLNKSTLINPSYGSGSNGLGIVDSVNFKELKVPLSVLGVSAGTTMHLEFWVTQEGTTKGPLDALLSDNVQMSHPSTTTYDTTAVVQMTTMAAYTVQNAVDNIPPTVSGALAVNFPLLANKQFNTTTNKIDVTFSEPVGLATAQTAGNYAFSGPVSRTVISAVRDANASNVVHLTLNSGISANAAFDNITVTNVRDLANNPIVANGTTNVGSFFIQNLTFNCDAHVGLCKGIFAPTDSFSIEGNVLPLTFALTDNAVMYDPATSDSVYTVVVPFCLPKGGNGKAEADLQWKFGRKNVAGSTQEFEPRGSNRNYHLTSDNGAAATLSEYWNDDNPANFTRRPVDVIFQVNAAAMNPLPADSLELLGNESPMSFTHGSGVLMRDDGVAPDVTANDKIYTARLTFPSCAGRNIHWKVHYRGGFECPDQGDRTFTLDDVNFSSAVPMTLPARRLNRCTVIDKAVTVVFKVDMTIPNHPGASDTVGIGGSVAPLDFNAPAANRMLDNGAGFDTKPNDYVFTRGVTFPDSSAMSVDFKYWLDGVFECQGFGNRNFTIDDVGHSTGNPQVRVISVWDYCTEATAVAPWHPADAAASFAVLRQSFPNPMQPRTAIQFELRRAGRVTLTVYDVIGRRVARLVDGDLVPGMHRVVWDGHDDGGLRVASGVYVYELAMGGERLTRRLVITR